ncbi:MAG: thioredoxin [Candidatus Symbiobacter sp.]|nr:thioredoxin [Candidatus Symbiobacter sp.]
MPSLIGGKPSTAPQSQPARGTPQTAAKPAQTPSRYRLGMDVNIPEFMTEVIEASMAVPVMVDFWAPWCGPCKTLGPILEKVVAETKNAVRLVKVDIDKNPELAGQLQIQSIPAVYAFMGGQPVDGFVGAVPESRVRSFVQRLVAAAGQLRGGAAPSPIDDAMAQAQELVTQGQLAEASAIFEAVVQHEPTHLAALAALGRCYLALQKPAKARQILEKINALPPAAATAAGTHAAPENADLIALRSGLELAEQARQSLGQEASYLDKLAANPNDHQARLDLALAHFAAGQREAAIDQVLEIIKRDRKWNDEAGRKQLLKFFEAIGLSDPLTVAARKRLSALLFS